MSLEQATRILLIRHGETAWNRSGRIQGHTDIPLNELGQRQAQRLAQALGEESIDAIYASDLQRAWATAQAVAGRHGLAVQQEPQLRERGFGRFEGLSWDQISAAHPEEAQRWRRRDPDFQVGGGESLTGFSARCLAAVVQLADRHPGGSIAVVAHGGVLDSVYRSANGIELQAPRTWVLGNATINRLLASQGLLRVVGWNDDGHLQGVSLDEAAA